MINKEKEMIIKENPGKLHKRKFGKLHNLRYII